MNAHRSLSVSGLSCALQICETCPEPRLWRSIRFCSVPFHGKRNISHLAILSFHLIGIADSLISNNSYRIVGLVSGQGPSHPTGGLTRSTLPYPWLDHKMF
ncbi:unnamed protein product, partial [Choristocarpus tenellus]